MACWIHDGSPGFTINGNVVTHVGDKRVYSVFNAMWEDNDGVSSGKHYWKIHFLTLEGGAGVGFTSKDHFNRGYACKALKYSGTLSNGGGVLVDKFGPKPKQGDTIGILAVFEGDRLKVCLDVNGKSLGLAFDVPASTFKSIFPVVSFHRSGSATCAMQAEIPDIDTETPTTSNGIEGDWKLVRVEENDGNECPLDITTHSVTAKIKNIDVDKYSVSVTIVNEFCMELSKVDGEWKTTDDVCITIKDHGRDFLQYTDIEGTVCYLMGNVHIVELARSGTLSILFHPVTTVFDIMSKFMSQKD